MKTALLGPLVPLGESPLWTFVLITGDPEADAKPDAVTATDQALLGAMRDDLARKLQRELGGRFAEYADEMELAHAAAALWPARFASMVAFGEVYLAGGGQA